MNEILGQSSSTASKTDAVTKNKSPGINNAESAGGKGAYARMYPG